MKRLLTTDSESGGAPAGSRSARVLSRRIVWTMWGLAGLVVLHLVVPAVMALRSADLAASIRAANPELSAENLRIATWAATLAAAAFHLVFVGAYVWLGAKVWAGRRWAHFALIAVLLAATALSAVSFVSSPMFRAVIPFGDVLQIVLVVLLWTSARDLEKARD